MHLPPPPILTARLARLHCSLASRQLDALLVTNLSNLAYLTGVFASAGAVLVTPAGVRVVMDHRYEEAVRARAADWPALTPVIVPRGSSYDAVIATELAALAGLRVGFEDHDLSVRRFRWLETQRRTMALPDFEPGTEAVEELRAVKDAWELKLLREAGTRLSEVAKCILPNALAGTVERGLAATLEAAMRAAGFERLAFDTIVASGPNGARPHHRAGERAFKAGDLVVVDFGGVLDGYAVDMTRTVAVGRPDARATAVLEAVAAAQAAAIEAVAPGVAPEAVDAAARAVLARAGLGDAFTHGTGHGLGLDVHERPRIGPARSGVSEPPLERDMVFTVEPGAYMPGWGGVRIEDDVLVTAAGVEVLT